MPMGAPLTDEQFDATPGTSGLARVRFTSTTPELKTWMAARSSA
jgi:hypothetical protein